MRIVIDISKNDYWLACNHPETLIGVYAQAIKNGTPLPKGHGALKDTDAICKAIISALGIRDENYLLHAEKAVYKRIKNAPTIIEADTGGEQE